MFSLPYRWIYAVATLDSILVYDTQQTSPIALLSGLHYSGITDVAWLPNDSGLVLASADGYVSIVVFENDELGHHWAGDLVVSDTVKDNAVIETSTAEAPPVDTEKRNVVDDENVKESALNVAAPNLDVKKPPVPGGKKRIAPTFLRAL